MPEEKVVKILPKSVHVYQDILQLLDDIRERVMKGDIYGIALISLHQDKSVGTVWTQGCRDSFHKTLGGIEYLKIRFIREEID